MPKSKQKRRKNKESSMGKNLLLGQSSDTLDSLLDKAEAEINNFNYEKAEELCKEILQIDSKHAKCIEILAGIYIEQFKFKEAEALLLQCMEMNPNSGHEKYFSLGQLSNGERSLTFYQKGIEILEKKLEDTENVEPHKALSKSALQRVLSDAYCSVGEIFMTDCCFEENAEEKCKTAIDSAVRCDPSNPEAYQCLTNFHLVKEELDDAKSAMEKSLSLWFPQHELLRDGESIETDLEKEPQFSIPAYDSRLKTSKLLIELELFDEGTKILDGLIDEDDEVLEVWYLLGWLNYLQGEEYKYNAYFYLKKAKEVGTKYGGDEDQISHIEELLEELKDTCPDDDDVNGTEEYQPQSSDSECDSDDKMET